MKEIHNENSISKLASIYSFLIIILICIPAYFYVQSEMNNYKFHQDKMLEEYGLNIQRVIYDFSDSKNNIFRFPKSFSMESYLLSKNKELIFSTTKNKLTYKNKISKKITLSINRLGAKHLIITKKFSYKQIYLKIAILTICIGLFIFISAYLIIKQSIIPYKKANKYLNVFFNDAMHELKTPLGVLQQNLEIVEDKKENQKEIIRSLNAVKNLRIIYEDIEYLMKNKHVKYTKENLDFSALVTQTIETFQGLAQSKNIKLHVLIEENIQIEFNRMELQRILDNTISNAIKYSNINSSIEIILKNSPYLYFKVQDYGIGIKNTAKVYDRYYKEDSIKGGIGIGLNIVKKICDKNSVKISCVSKLNNGTTFIYYFNK